MNITIRLALAFALVFTFVLAGCSSGGGSSDDTATAMMPAPLASGSSGGKREFKNTLAGNIGDAHADALRQAATAATARPRQGSVTQSSNVDSNNVTLDQVEATASYNSDGSLSVAVTNLRTGAWGTIDSSDITLRNNILPGTNTRRLYQQRTLAKEIGDGVVFVDVFTSVRNTDTTDTDYLVAGVWLLVPDLDTPSDLEIGAFVDGPNDSLTPATYLYTTATASYQGDATGLFLETDNESGGEFVADVALTANFGPTDPSIEGQVTNFQLIDSSRTIVVPVAGNPALTLGSALIGTDQGGFFTGDTSSNRVIDGVTYISSGKWGGQFYGEQANRVIGTFGGNSKNNPGNPDYELTFVGAFGAGKQ